MPFPVTHPRRTERWTARPVQDGLGAQGCGSKIVEVPSPFEVVLEFFACFDRGDLERAGQLVAEDAVITLFVSGEDPVELRGFESFVAWYSRRRELLGDSFSYRVEELLPGIRHAVALIALSRGAGARRTNWRQVAVYTVDEGVVTALRGYEEPQTRSGSW